MYILQFVIEEVKQWIWLVFSSLLGIEHRCAGKAALWLPPYAGRKPLQWAKTQTEFA
jgi:hypothetical protein